MYMPGADPGFQVRGGALKKNWPNGGVFRVKKHDFTPKNHILSNCGGRREQFWGISCEKSRFYAKKSYFYNFRGGAHLHAILYSMIYTHIIHYIKL